MNRIFDELVSVCYENILLQLLMDNEFEETGDLKRDVKEAIKHMSVNEVNSLLNDLDEDDIIAATMEGHGASWRKELDTEDFEDDVYDIALDQVKHFLEIN